MKCDHCPLKNCSRQCEGEIAQHLCKDERYLKIFKEKAESKQCVGEIGNGQYPTFVEQTVNFVGSMIGFAKSGFKIVSDEVYNNRISICKSCEEYNKEDERCFKCGCVTSWKARISKENCPLGHWLAEEVSPDNPSSNTGRRPCCGG